jgi:hypothetical protein
MKIINRFIITVAGCLIATGLAAQHSPTEIKYSVMDFYSLRYYPFATEADSIIRQVIERHSKTASHAPVVHQKTSVGLVANKEFLDNQIRFFAGANDLIYRYIIKSYKPWLQYAAPLKDDSKETVLTIGLHEDYRKNTALGKSKNEGIYEFIGKQNVAYLLDEIMGDIDLFENKNEAMLLPFKSPLTKKNKNSYKYFLSATKMMDNQPVYEIAFYPENIRDNAFAGYLYVTADGHYSLVKARFTLNNLYNMNFVRDILIIQTFETKENKTFPIKKETVFTLGDEMRGSFLVNRTVDYTAAIEPPTASEKQVENVVAIASQTRSFGYLQKGIHLLLTDHLTIGGDKGLFEWGPVTESVSYNRMEGLRLKASGNTTLKFHKQWLLGGYLAYGSNDKQFKYRGEVIYSLLPKDKDIWEFPKRLFNFTYVRDLNIPGQDLLTSNRDRFFYSLSHAATRNMSLQKLAAVHYEHELRNRLSFKIGGKYLHDHPMGLVQYFQDENDVIINDITTSEMNVSLRYAPREAFIQNREDRFYVRKGNVELNFRHRIGLKGILGSNYHYQITDFSAYKKFYFPQSIGTVDVRFSAGKVWNRLPFPLLFIPEGNHSYVFEENAYNLMDFYEFTTDRFVAGNVNFQFNWSPVNWFFKSDIKTSLGAKTIYGPLSDNNNPALHPGLYSFNQGVKPLGNEPYVEMNIGLSNIFKMLRIEWVQRLTYLEEDGGGKKNKGSFFVTTGFFF